MIGQDVWQVHYQVLSVHSLHEFIKLYVNMDMIIKNSKRVELNKKIVVYQYLCCNKKRFLIHANHLAIISINLFCCYEKVFTHMNTCMIGENSMKLHYLKKKIFAVTQTWKILLMQIKCIQKYFVKILK